MKELVDHWLQMDLTQLTKELRQNLIDNEVFTEEFGVFAMNHGASESAAQSEVEFLSRIEWNKVHRWLHQEWKRKQDD